MERPVVCLRFAHPIISNQCLEEVAAMFVRVGVIYSLLKSHITLP